MNQKLNIALLMGGDSGEYEISIGSAGVIERYINKDLFEVYPVLIHHGNWYYQDKDENKFPIDKNDFSLTLAGERIIFDCAFIAIHGTPGEDGKLQGYLDLIGIPYTSCDLTTSSLTFNKYFCNDLAISYGQNVASTVMIRKGTSIDASELIEKVGLPCFVKPNKAGSSVGVSKVYQPVELLTAIEKAFLEDDEILVQEFIQGREMACGVFRKEGRIIVLPVTEIISKKDFFDYEAKYTSGMAEEITPAVISDAEREECSEMTAFLYEKFNCKGVVRFDYFLNNGKWWFLEVNTIPGLSEGSIVPKQAIAAGYNLGDFFTTLITEAISTA